MELKSLTQRIKCMESESGSLRMFLESLVLSSVRLGVPFIAPRQLGAVGDNLGRQFLPSVEWCAGKSGAPPDNHCSCLLHDLLPNQAHPTIAPPGPLVHRTLSGAPADHWSSSRVARRLRGRPLALVTVASPDSLVHHRTVR
jgi:hypothetical protein